MDALVMKLLAKKPEDRYGSAAELEEDLRRAREGLSLAFVGSVAGRADTDPPLTVPAAPVPGSTGSAPPDSLRRKPRRATAAAAALAALLALLGVLGWDLSRTPEGLGTAQKPDPPKVVRSIPRRLDFLSGGGLEFLRVGARESHPRDRRPRAENPIGYADHCVDHPEVPHVAQDHP